MTLAKEIFRAYDIRGIVDQTLTEKTVYQIGQAIGTVMQQSHCTKIVIGRDGRLSSPRLSQQLIAGLCATGREVIDIGEVPTPLLYFATHHLDIDCGVIITGSHNPINYNGLKIIVNGEALHDETIQALYHTIQQATFYTGKGRSYTREITQAYIEYIAKHLYLARPLHVVIDCGNGVAGAIAPALYRKLGCKVTELYCEVDGNFPNHHPDPGDPKNLVDLQRAVLEKKADIGLAFDGDADRLGIIDNTGELIYPDRVLMLIAKDILQRHPGATIIYDVKCSNQLAKLIPSWGGEPCMWKTGHSLIKAKMRETNALLAGEMSGHLFIKDQWFGFDDGIYAGARVLNLLTQTNHTAEQFFAQAPAQVSTPELLIDVAEAEKFPIMQALLDNPDMPEAIHTATIDGLRVEFEQGWGLIRASNTQPKLVARFEAVNQEILDKIRDLFQKKLSAVNPALQIP